MALFGLAVFHLVVQLAVVAPRELIRNDRNRDITVYWRTAKNVQASKPIYLKRPGYGPDHYAGPVYIYPPPFAAVIRPLGKLPFNTFSQLWFLLNFAAFWIFAWALAKLSGKGSLRRVLICALITGVCPGAYFAIWLGQISPMLWALFAVGLVGFGRSTLWSLATLVKAFYVWPLLVHLTETLHSDGIKVLLRTIAPAVVIIGTAIVYGGVVCGWSSYAIWLHDVLPTLSQGNFNRGNLSISFAVLRLATFLGWNYPGGPLAFLPHLWLTSASIGAPILTWYLLRSRSSQIKSAAVIAATVLFAPVCWSNYLPLLLPLVALLFREKSLPRLVQG